MGKAIQAHQDTTNIRRKIEAIFRNRPAQYSIVEVTYDPIAHWKTGAVTTKKVLDTFTAEIL
jgi:hypothetical protein